MIVVTGGAGFIGSQLVAGLNRSGRSDIIVVDNLTNGKKFINLSNNDIADYYDKHKFREFVRDRDKISDSIEVIFHQGACSSTTEWDGRYMLDNNFTYSKELFHFALEREIPFIYASSAAVYGVNTHFAEEPVNESPVNVYGYSKLLFDNYLRQYDKPVNSQLAGLRYFNVFGPGEAHKDSMASVAFHFDHQLKQTSEVKLFEGSHGYADGEQLRDFIYIDDVVAVNLWFWKSGVSGIFNIGTGKAHSFNAVAEAVIKWHRKGKISYIPFPDNLKDSYQSYTEADISKLRQSGYESSFTSLEESVNQYMKMLNPA